MTTISNTSARRGLALLTVAMVLCTITGIAVAATKAQKQDEMRKVASNTLAQLYRLQPRAKTAINKAAGYAVFSNFGMKILVAGGGKGEGVAVDNQTKSETFMKMVQVQAGLGFGIKKFRLVWVFETPEALNNFVNSGWEFGAQSTAAAQLGGQGAWATGALSVSPGVWVYQIIGSGLALELTAKGTKYYKDDELN
jgi:lipid-binding SYLF domain-containing protein